MAAPPGRSRSRLILLGLAGVLLVAITGLIMERERLASRVLPLLAAAQGLPLERATVTRLDTAGMELRDLTMPGLAIRRLDIALSWDGMFAPSLDTVIIDGVDAALGLDGAHRVLQPAWLGTLLTPDATSQADLQVDTARQAAEEEPALPALPLARLVLRNATLDIARPDGAITVNLGAVVESGMEGLPQARVEVDGTVLAMGLRLEGDLTPRHGETGPVLALGLTGRLSAPEGGTRLDTAITLAVAGDTQSGWRLAGIEGPFRIAADAALPALARLAGPQFDLAGRVVLDARGTAEAGMAALLRPGPEGLNALDGTLEITLDQVAAAVPGLGAVNGVTGSGTLEGSLGGRWLRVARTLGIDIASIDSPFLDMIPADFEVPTPLTDARLELRTLELDIADLARPGGDILIWFNSPPANLRLAGDARLNLSADIGAPLLSASALRVWGVAKAMRGVAGSASISLEDLSVRLNGATASFTSEAELSVSVPGLAAPLPVVAALAGKGEWAEDALAITLSDRTAIRLARVDLPGGRSIRPGRSDPALRIAEGREGLIRLRPDDPAASLSLELPLRSSSVTLVGFDTEGPLTLETGPVDLSATTTAQAVSLSRASVRSAARGVAVEGLAGLARIDGTAAELSASFDRLRLNGEDLLRAPVVATASLRDLAGAAPAIKAALSGADGRVKAELSGALGPRGRLQFTLAPITFTPGVFQPGDISPMAAGLANVVGEIGATGTLSLGARPGGQIDLDLAGIGLDVGPGRISAVTGQIAFDLAQPPATLPAQQLGALMEIGGVLAGPIDLLYAVQPDGGLVIDRLTVPVLEGALSARGVLIPPGAETISADIGVAGVNLTSVFGLVDLEGLTGTGKISGSLPVTYTNGAVAIEGGRLAADGPGVISYRGGALDEQLSAVDTGVDLLLRALEDFRYEALSMQISKSLSGAGLIGLSLEGSNPAVLDGYPFRLNINLESDFDRLSGFLLLGFAATEDVLRWTAGQTR